ncbi:MAG: hypothetical protein ACI9S8_000753 [Chlamydiales bacterium]|jgi:hypothetical protein
MTHPEHQGKEQLSNKEMLKNSLRRLAPEYLRDLRSKEGLSGTFQKQVSNIESTLQKCEKSMKRLASDYLKELSTFNSTESPLEATEALQNSESIWREESKVILTHSFNGDESDYLERLRKNALQIMENKLIENCRDNSAKNITARVTLSSEILATMDQIYEGQGYPGNSPTRNRLRRIAESFI